MAVWRGQPFAADSARGRLAGEWLCSEEFPYRGRLHSIQGDVGFFANHLGTPGPAANSPRWLCDCNREDNPWNDFVKEFHSPNMNVPITILARKSNTQHVCTLSACILINIA